MISFMFCIVCPKERQGPDKLSEEETLSQPILFHISGEVFYQTTARLGFKLIQCRLPSLMTVISRNLALDWAVPICI